MQKIYLFALGLTLASCQFFTQEFVVTDSQGGDYTSSPYEEYGTTGISHDSECDTDEGYDTYYQESGDDGYYYAEECNYDDYFNTVITRGSCQTTESYGDFGNTCTQIFNYEDLNNQQTIEETCYDSDGGNDHSLEIYSDGEDYWDFDYFSQYEYFYVEDRRNLSGSCLTDSAQGIYDQGIESYQYSINSPSELIWAEFDECIIPPVYDGCFGNCTTTSNEGDYASSVGRNVGSCNDETYNTLKDNFEEVELTAEAGGCGSSTNRVLPQDDDGFIELLGTRIHCPTICWEQENVFDLLLDTEIIPLSGYTNLTAQAVSP